MTSAAQFSERRKIWRRIVRNPLHLFTLSMVALLVLTALFADLLAPYGATEVVAYPFELPTAQFWLGTDSIGRDIFSRIIHGSRVSLYVGFASTAIAVVFGVPMGVVSGYFGKLTDTIMMRTTDGLLAFPPIILAMAMVAVLGTNLRNTIIAIGIVQIPRFARLVRGMALSLKESEFITAGRALGASHVYLMQRSLLPPT